MFDNLPPDCGPYDAPGDRPQDVTFEERAITQLSEALESPRSAGDFLYADCEVHGNQEFWDLVGAAVIEKSTESMQAVIEYANASITKQADIYAEES